MSVSPRFLWARSPQLPAPSSRKNHCLHAISLASICFLAGCATPRAADTALPVVNVPANWSSTGAAVPVNSAADAMQTPTSLVQWWQRLGDEQLSGLIEQALLANTTVRSAIAALQQSRAQRDVVAAGLLPNVNASGSGQRSRSGGASSNSYQTGFDASWEPDIFGRLSSALNASEQDSLAAEASLANTQVSLAAEVAFNYINLRNFQTRLAIARSNLSSQQETLQITQWRVQAGLANSLAAEQSRAATAQTAAQIPALQLNLDQSRHSLAVLTGQAPAALDAVLDQAKAVPLAPVDLALVFPADTLRQRPDVAAAERRVQAALARVSQAEAARYPSFRISGSLGLRALTVGALTGGGSSVSSLLGSISAPLLDGGALRAQVRSQEAALEQTRVAYEATVLTALQDVEDALVAIKGDTERLARLQVAAEAAENAGLLARYQYTSGLIDFQSVLDTQRTLLSTQDSVATAQANITTDHVRLYKALGGGWQ